MTETAIRAELLRWPAPSALLESPSIRARDAFSARIKDAPLAGVIRKFCQCDVENLVRIGLKCVGPPRGVGVELGSGSGLLGALVAREPGVRTIYAIDPSEGMHRHVASRIGGEILGEDDAKIRRVVGSFDQMQLPDASVDFALNFHSLHHADDLTVTLRETARVLKPNGWILSFDRVQPDSMTDEEIDRLLSYRYPERSLRANGYPGDMILTRRGNGEHEIRLRDWRQAFADAGLTIAAERHPKAAISRRAAAKGALSLLPRFLTRRLYRDPNAHWRSTTGWFGEAVGRATMRHVYFQPRDWPTTMIVGRKKGRGSL